MQHPDEGTIHSWLDGALTAEEAARVDSHVSECPVCAAAVAEARGFIAASSRILTALDDIPRGVLPAVPVKKRDLRVFWRAAAAMLVVAGGSLVVMREGGQDARVSTTTKEAVTFTASPAAPPAAALGSAEGASVGASGGDSTARTDARAISRLPTAVSSARVQEKARAEMDLSSPVEVRRASEPVTGVAAGAGRGATRETARGTTAQRFSADANAPPTAVSQLQANIAPLESEAAPLKVLRIERSLGSRRTVYEIAPSQTVTLSEPEMPAEGIVLRGAASGVPTAGAQRRATVLGAHAAPMSVEAAKAPPPPADLQDSKTADSVVRDEMASTAKTSAAQTPRIAAITAAANTISWTDSQTGKTLTLSGTVSVERLQEIRKRIERERAAAIKKVP